MSIYVMSDIHGHYKAFREMLYKIKFGKADLLYIIGDVMEYDNEPLKIMDYIMENENIILLKGNQEDIFVNEIKNIIEIDYFVEDNSNIENMVNTDDIIARRGREYAVKLRDYLISLPYIHILDKFILVHGDFILPENHEKLSLNELLELQDEHNCIYGRDLAMNNEYLEGFTIILGHTIVMIFDRSKECILHKEGKILIDCGAAIGRTLGCLRLDDMEEYYVKV